MGVNCLLNLVIHPKYHIQFEVKWRESSSSKAASSAARKAERSARKRHRSRGIRLKLSQELCLAVARGLIRLLTAGGDQLPTPGKLVACKVR